MSNIIEEVNRMLEKIDSQVRNMINCMLRVLVEDTEELKKLKPTTVEKIKQIVSVEYQTFRENIQKIETKLIKVRYGRKIKYVGTLRNLSNTQTTGTNKIISLQNIIPDSLFVQVSNNNVKIIIVMDDIKYLIIPSELYERGFTQNEVGNVYNIPVLKVYDTTSDIYMVGIDFSEVSFNNFEIILEKPSSVTSFTYQYFMTYSDLLEVLK